MQQFTAVYEKSGDWWLGFIEELPGANTQGHTLDETRENLREQEAFGLLESCQSAGVDSAKSC